MIFVLILLLKTIIWFFVFRFGTREDMTIMLVCAAVVTVILTLMDKVSVASNLAFSAILLTLVLYGLMSFTLLPLAWKVKKATPVAILNLMGMIGAFAGVNFTMDFLRGFQTIMSR